MAQNIKADNRGYAGTTGFGKSYIAGADVESVVGTEYWPIILDKKEDHAGLANFYGFTHIEVNHNVAQNITVDELKTLLSSARSDSAGMWITFDRGDPLLSQQDMVEFGNKLAMAVYSLTGDHDANWYVLYEELKNFTPDQYDTNKFQAVLNMLSEGRSIGIKTAATMQYAQQVSYKVRKSITKWYVYQMDEEDDYNFLVRNSTLVDVDALEGEIEQKVRRIMEEHPNYRRDDHQIRLIDVLEGSKQEDRLLAFRDKNEQITELRCTAGLERESPHDA